MNVYSLSALCFSFGSLLILILTLSKRRDRLAYKFLFFSIAICGWSFLFSLWISQVYSKEAALMILRISYLFVVFIPTTWLDFVFEFIGKKVPFSKFFLLNYLISFSLLIFCPTPFMFLDMQPFMNFKYMPLVGFAHHFHILHFFTIVPYGIYELVKAYRLAEGYRKNQIRYFVISTVIGFSVGSTIYLPYYGVPFELYLLILLPIYPILTGIALTRHGLFDLQQIADAFQREKMAAVGTMAASLNHELRNPLYVASGKIESYRDAVERGLYPTAEERQENAERVMESASGHLKRAMDILQRFSNFSKPFNAGRDKEKVILSETFRNVFELVSNEFKIQKVKVNYEPTNGLYIHANGRQMEEILFNLIMNACHAMEEKGGELSIKAAQPGGRVVVEISDTGPGIPEENQSQIFEPFYTTKEQGTGLGLYITKQLVERNGGKISVKSKPGAGTSFILEFKR